MATQPPEKQLRDFTLSVRLRPDMRERLYAVADGLGVSPATVASIAIGQYVATAQASTNATTRAIEGMMSSLAPQMADLISTISQPETESENPCSSFKDSSEQLPLLAAEPTKKPAKSSLSEKSSKSKPSTRVASSKSKPLPSPTSKPLKAKPAKK
jgi:predicted transcriptional regulator